MSSLESRYFIRTKEDFTCVTCSSEVHGNGYTDHCPDCLTSLHVDINPGDRREECRGVMKPIAYSPSRNTIYYRCEKCGQYSRVKAANDDNGNLLTELSTHPIPAEAS